MLEKVDTTYNDLRDKSISQWLDEISNHKDIVVRGGVKVTRDYIAYLKKEIINLENKNSTKDKYLEKLKMK